MSLDRAKYPQSQKGLYDVTTAGMTANLLGQGGNSHMARCWNGDSVRDFTLETRSGWVEYFSGPKACYPPVPPCLLLVFIFYL